MDLPEELISKIYSYLSLSQLYTLTNDKKIINNNILKIVIKNRFPKINNCNGFINNFYGGCFLCNKTLISNYNLILCYFCSIQEDDKLHYPIVCHDCCIKKLKRGEINFTFCNICHKPTSHLGITPFS